MIQRAVVEEHGFKTVDYLAGSGRVIGAVSDAFSPFGDGSWEQMVSPTITDPLVQIATNQKFHGGPLRPEDSIFDNKSADYIKYWEKSPPSWPSRAVTKYLSLATGGFEKPLKEDKEGNPKMHYKAGWFDMNPTSLDHLFGFVTGGMGKFAMRTLNMGINFATGQKPLAKDIPFVRQFYGQPTKTGSIEKRLIREMMYNSEQRTYNHVDVARFKRYVFDAIMLGALSDRQKEEVADENGNKVPRVIRDFLNNQRLSKGLKKHSYKKKKKGRVTF